MAYFDSPKNRAMWEKELKSLRQEKARRQQQGFAPDAATQKTAFSADVQMVRRISLEELVTMQREAEGIRRVARPTRSNPMEMSAKHTLEREPNVPSKHAPARGL